MADPASNARRGQRRRRAATVGNPTSALVPYTGGRVAQPTVDSGSVVARLERDVASLIQLVSGLVNGPAPPSLPSNVGGPSADNAAMVRSVGTRIDQASGVVHRPGPFGGSGIMGKSPRVDCVLSVSHAIKAADAVYEFRDGTQTEHEASIRGKDALLKAVRFVFSNDGTADASGVIRALICPKIDEGPADSAAMLLQGAHLRFEFGKLPKEWIVPVPENMEFKGADLANKSPGVKADVTIYRKRNGLADTDTVCFLTCQFLFGIA